jgi:hypothetical protein
MEVVRKRWERNYHSSYLGVYNDPSSESEKLSSESEKLSSESEKLSSVFDPLLSVT